jgi:SulP family sulfate permease
MIAFLEARRAGLFASRHWLPNIVAGLVVGVVALPLSMAFAIASGARPEQGLYTAIVAGVIVTLFGGSRLQIAGPTGAFVAILVGITAKYGIGGLQVATLMAGVLLLAMGLARLGGVIRFIPSPVIIGFTSGIGIIIFVGQWQAFFGLRKPQGAHFHEQIWQLLQQLPQSHGATVAFGLLSLALVLFAPRVPGLRRIPGPLVAMLVATVLQAVLQLPGVATIGSAFGGIPTGLPSFQLPQLSPGEMLTLLGPAFTIAMLGAIESLLSAVVADGMTGTRHDSNQELVGQGLANIAAPLFGGFAATGAIARTATNIRNGATGPLAGVVHALTLVAVLLFLAPLAAGVPLAALAAILFVTAWNMSEVRHFAHLLATAPVADRVILCVTFLLTVFADLVVAVNVGVILAILQFLRRMSETVESAPVTAADLATELARHGLPQLPKDVIACEVAGPLFFGAVGNVERALLQTHTDPRVMIIRLWRVPFVDATGLRSLREITTKLAQRGVMVLYCEAKPAVLPELLRGGIVGPDALARHVEGFEEAVRLALAGQAPVPAPT